MNNKEGFRLCIELFKIIVEDQKRYGSNFNYSTISSLELGIKALESVIDNDSNNVQMDKVRYSVIKNIKKEAPNWKELERLSEGVYINKDNNIEFIHFDSLGYWNVSELKISNIPFSN